MVILIMIVFLLLTTFIIVNESHATIHLIIFQLKLKQHFFILHPALNRLKQLVRFFIFIILPSIKLNIVIMTISIIHSFAVVLNSIRKPISFLHYWASIMFHQHPLLLFPISLTFKLF